MGPQPGSHRRNLLFPWDSLFDTAALYGAAGMATSF